MQLTNLIRAFYLFHLNKAVSSEAKCLLDVIYCIKKQIHGSGTGIKVSKGAKIRNGYNQAPHLTQDTNGKVTNSQLDTTNESQEVNPFPAGGHLAHINRRAQRYSNHKT